MMIIILQYGTQNDFDHYIIYEDRMEFPSSLPLVHIWCYAQLIIIMDIMIIMWGHNNDHHMTRWSSFDNLVITMILIITYEDNMDGFCPSHLPTSCVPIQIWWSFNIYILWFDDPHITLYWSYWDTWVLMECLSPSSPAARPTFHQIWHLRHSCCWRNGRKKTELWRSIVSIELELECTCKEIFSTQNRFGSLVFQWKDLFPTEFAIFRILISRSKVEFLAFSQHIGWW